MGRGGSTGAPNCTENVAVCTARDAGADVRSQGLTPARGRVPHLLRVGEATAAARTEASARRLRDDPHPGFQVALAAPKTSFDCNSTPPACRSSLALALRLYSSCRLL